MTSLLAQAARECGAAAAEGAQDTHAWRRQRAARTDRGEKGGGFAFELRTKIIKTSKAKDGCLQNLNIKLKFG